MNSKEKIVLIGGGGGVYRLAKALRHAYPEHHITTIQTVFDSGGHSGKLRDEHGILPPGDIRRAILALSDEHIEPDLRELLSYRFTRAGAALDDASVGNILLTALVDMHGGLIPAIEAMCRIFNVTGTVLPVSLDSAELCATLSDGSHITGEGNIDSRPFTDDRYITSVYLEPKATIYRGAYDAITHADKIVICPGDLYTSIIPNVLVDGFNRAIAERKGQLIYVMNIMTKKTETHNFKASDFAKTILSYMGCEKFDTIICNNTEILPHLRAQYTTENAEPVNIDENTLSTYTDHIITADLADQNSDIVRHNAHVADLISEL